MLGYFVPFFSTFANICKHCRNILYGAKRFRILILHVPDSYAVKLWWTIIVVLKSTDCSRWQNFRQLRSQNWKAEHDDSTCSSILLSPPTNLMNTKLWWILNLGKEHEGLVAPSRCQGPYVHSWPWDWFEIENKEWSQDPWHCEDDPGGILRGAYVYKWYLVSSTH